MRKISVLLGIIVASFALFGIITASKASASDVPNDAFCLGNNQCFNQSAVLTYLCFADLNCYDVKTNKLAFKLTINPITQQPNETRVVNQPSQQVEDHQQTVIPTLISEVKNYRYLPNHNVIKLTASGEEFKFKAITIIPKNREAFYKVDIRLCDENEIDITSNCKLPVYTYCEVLNRVFPEYSDIQYPYNCPLLYNNSSIETQFHAFGSTDVDWFGRPINRNIVIPAGSNKYLVYSKVITLPLLKFESTSGKIVDINF